MSNTDVVNSVYAALGRGDVDAVVAVFDDDIEWCEAEGHPYQADGRVWRGSEAIVQNLFLRLATEWDAFTVMPTHVHDAGPTVVVEGRYRGTVKATANRLDAQFCHIWQVRGGKVTAFQQYADTAQLQAVTSR
jgi:ketosteroid isomerase-like protein